MGGRVAGSEWSVDVIVVGNCLLLRCLPFVLACLVAFLPTLYFVYSTRTESECPNLPVVLGDFLDGVGRRGLVLRRPPSAPKAVTLTEYLRVHRGALTTAEILCIATQVLSGLLQLKERVVSSGSDSVDEWVCRNMSTCNIPCSIEFVPCWFLCVCGGSSGWLSSWKCEGC